FNGTSKFEENPFPDIRAMFSVHPEPFTLLVRGDSDISGFDQIVGKRVNVGNPGSGQRATMEVVMEAFGIGMGDLALATEYKGSEMAKQICDGNIDAMIYTVGHPAAAIQEATTTCDVKLVDVVGEPIDKLVSENPYYRVATIPGGMYAGNDDETTTFGVGATFVTSADVSEDVAYTVAKAVMSNLEDFRGLHPAFANLDAAEMVSDGLSAPLHPGAEKAYKELGLMN
ncbi:MAG: TAXI family TRAP transporter solute-binding subunit, partial [Pseudomonadota bacterium]